MNKETGAEKVKTWIRDQKAAVAADLALFPVGKKIVTAYGEAIITEHVGSHVAFLMPGDVISQKMGAAELKELVAAGQARIE